MPMLQSFSNSFFGQIVKVWYSLRVYVKHDGMCDFGEGNSKGIPIKIYSKVNNLNSSQGLFNAPAAWNPNIAPQTNLQYEYNDQSMAAGAQVPGYFTN